MRKICGFLLCSILCLNHCTPLLSYKLKETKYFDELKIPGIEIKPLSFKISHYAAPICRISLEIKKENNFSLEILDSIHVQSANLNSEKIYSIIYNIANESEWIVYDEPPYKIYGENVTLTIESYLNNSNFQISYDELKDENFKVILPPLTVNGQIFYLKPIHYIYKK
jgi:hypothetical protein